MERIAQCVPMASRKEYVLSCPALIVIAVNIPVQWVLEKRFYGDKFLPEFFDAAF
jgi:hypothetical protein